MGLDMWLHKTRNNLSKPVDFQSEVSASSTEEIFYWRKNYEIHGWMERLYYKKGGIAESFNCDPVELTLDEINELEKVLSVNNNPNDAKFIEKAKSAIAEGYRVFYDSWW
jgi:hypothetical protein